MKIRRYMTMTTQTRIRFICSGFGISVPNGFEGDQSGSYTEHSVRQTLGLAQEVSDFSKTGLGPLEMYPKGVAF